MCSRFLLFILNFVIFSVGVAVIVLASLVLSHTSDFSTFLHSGAITIPIILLIFGICVNIVGFLGCCGALRKSPCLLNTYAIILMVLALCQLGVGIYAVVARDDLKKWPMEGMADVFSGYNYRKAAVKESVSYGIDMYQHSLQCCGIESYKDWWNTTVIPGAIRAGDVTVGCCREMPVNGNSARSCIDVKGLDEQAAAKLIYTQGCFTKYYDLIENNNFWMIICAISLGVIQLVCVFAACTLARSSSRQERYNHY